MAEADDSCLLLSLPGEVLLHIGSFLESRNLVNFALTCKKLKKLVDYDSSTWKRIFNEYKLTRSQLIEETVDGNLLFQTK